jgi:hypothetical protein
VPILNADDANISMIALSNIVENKPNQNELNPVLNHKIEALKEMLEQPDLYATPENSNAFKSVIIGRINKKINELKSLCNSSADNNPSELQTEIDRHKKHIEEVQESRTIFAEATPPAEGSDAHTISMQQFLTELNAQYNNESISQERNRPLVQHSRAIASSLPLAVRAMNILNSLNNLEISIGVRNNFQDNIWIAERLAPMGLISEITTQILSVQGPQQYRNTRS